MVAAKHLRVIIDGALPGFLNMAIDEVLLDGRGTRYAYTLRLYGWARPTVSLGYAQPWRQGYEPEIAAREGIDLVRRRTGGRAVLHADEMTYSISGPADRGPFEGGVQSTYKIVAAGLAAGLRRLGVPVELVRSHGRQPRQEPGACFATRALYELTADGRKLLGSAQRRQRGRALQHGSLLLGEPDARQWRVLGPTGSAAARHSVGLAALLGNRPAWRSLAATLARGLGSELRLSSVVRGLSAAERRHVAAVLQRYRDPGFTYSR